MKYIFIFLLTIISLNVFTQDLPMSVHVHPPYSHDLNSKETNVVKEVLNLISLNEKLIHKIEEIVLSEDTIYSFEVKKYILEEYLKFYNNAFQNNTDLIVNNLIKYNLFGGTEWDFEECEKKHAYLINLTKQVKNKIIFKNEMLLEVIAKYLLSSRLISNCDYFENIDNKEYFILQYAYLFKENVDLLKKILLKPNDRCLQKNIHTIIVFGKNDPYLKEYYK